MTSEAEKLARFFSQLDNFMESEGWKKARKQLFVSDRKSICRNYSKKDQRIQLWFTKAEITLSISNDFLWLIRARYQSATVKSSDAKGYSF